MTVGTLRGIRSARPCRCLLADALLFSMPPIAIDTRDRQHTHGQRTGPAPHSTPHSPCTTLHQRQVAPEKHPCASRAYPTARGPSPLHHEETDGRTSPHTSSLMPLAFHTWARGTMCVPPNPPDAPPPPPRRSPPPMLLPPSPPPPPELSAHAHTQAGTIQSAAAHARFAGRLPHVCGLRSSVASSAAAAIAASSLTIAIRRGGKPLASKPTR